MKIGFCYDCCEDYGFNSNDLSYCDFISPSAITFVKNTIQRCGYEVELIGNYKQLLLKISSGFDFDIILTAAEGIKSRNRESWISSIAEMNKIPYIGTDAYGTIVTLDKALTKIIANHLNILTPPFVEINDSNSIANAQELKYPLIVKPNFEGSSMGVSIVNNIAELENHCEYLLNKYSQKILAEKYIKGKEITVSIYEIENEPKVFGMVESIQNNGEIMPIYSSEIKRIYGCKKILPRINKSVENKIMENSIKIYKYLDCKDYCRVDFRLDENDTPYLIEVTPLPALSATASFMMAAKLNNISPNEVFNTIIHNACSRYGLFPKS